MIVKLCLLGLMATLPATAYAQTLTDTHEHVSVPGKTVVAYRPLERNDAPTLKCHPDSTKAVGCEAHARHKAQQLASKRDAEAVRLGSR